MNGATERLLFELRARIIDELFVEQWREVSFFPEWEGVRGWQGTQDIIFAGLNPSTGRFPSQADKLLYRQLKLNGFENAHLTDIIKLRLTAGRVRQILQDTALMDQQRLYLLKEIDIVKPRLVVPMGDKAAAILRRWLPDASAIRPIPHYSPKIPTNQNLDKFSRAMRDVRAEYGSYARLPSRL